MTFTKSKTFIGSLFMVSLGIALIAVSDEMKKGKYPKLKDQKKWQNSGIALLVLGVVLFFLTYTSFFSRI